MSDSDFDQMFGGASPNRPSFAERLGRGTEAPAPPPVEPAAEKGEYRAYGCFPTNGLGETCDVQRWIDDTEVAEGIEFQYRFLMQVGYVGEEEIRLMLPDTIILLEGKHLRELRKKLARRQVHHIAQYSQRVWPMKPAQGEPIVEKITVIRPKAL